MVQPELCRGHVLVLPSPRGSEGPGRAGHALTVRASAAGEGRAKPPRGIARGAACPRFLPGTSPVGLTVTFTEAGDVGRSRFRVVGA